MKIYMLGFDTGMDLSYNDHESGNLGVFGTKEQAIEAMKAHFKEYIENPPFDFDTHPTLDDLKPDDDEADRYTGPIHKYGCYRMFYTITEEVLL